MTGSLRLILCALPSRNSSRTRLPYLASSVLIALGCAALANGSTSPLPVALSLDAPVTEEARFAYVVQPEVKRVLTPEQRLDQKLAAFAEEVEARPEPSARFAAPIEFDAERLDTRIGEIVGQLRGRADVSVHVRDLPTDAILVDYKGKSFMLTKDSRCSARVLPAGT